MKYLFVFFFILISINVVGQWRKIEKRVYSNFREGKLDLALEELQDLHSKYEENSFFHYWKAYIFIEKLNQYKNTEWNEYNRDVCLKYIENGQIELDLAIRKLTLDELSGDKQELTTLFPGCYDENFINPNLYSNCPSCRTNGVDARNAKELIKKFYLWKEYISNFQYNINIIETVKQYIEEKKDIQTFMNSILDRVKYNPSKNPLHGEISRDLYLKLAEVRNKIELEKIKNCEDCLLNYLKTHNEDEYLSIIPDIEKLINQYYFKRLSNGINNNHKDSELIIGGYNMYIEQLEKELKELNSNPQKILMNLYQFSGFSSKFIEERKVLCNQTIQLAIQKKDEYIISMMNQNAKSISKENVSNDEYSLNNQLKECEAFLKKFLKYSPYESYNLINKRKEDILKNLNLIAVALNKKNEFNANHLFNNVIEEDFANNSPYWDEKDNVNEITKIINGKLIINSKNNFSINSICRFTLTPKEDYEINEFSLTSSIEWKKGIDNNSYGIIFGAKGFSNCYSFGISAIGNYVLWKYTNGSYSYPIPYTPSSEIKNKGKNILTVVKNHNVIELYINYAKVNEITLTDFFGDEIGLNVSGVQEIEFEDYIISYNSTEIYKESKFGSGPIIKDIEGKTYKTTYIGKDLWTAENLNVSKFRNGELIPLAKNKEEWDIASDNQSPCWCYLNFNAANGKIFGKLYNWYAVDDKRGIAPEGWHVATSKDYSDLLKITENGNELKSKTRWKLNNGTDKYGFSALPGFSLDLDIGYSGHYNYGADRWDFFSDNYQSDRTGFWTSTHNYLDFETSSTSFTLYDNDSVDLSDNSFKSRGMYIRCVKD